MTLKKWILALLMILLLIPCGAMADPAADISDECRFNNHDNHPNSPGEMRDESYRSFYKGSYLNIEAPQGKLIGSVQIKWRTINMPGVNLWKQDDRGEWVMFGQDGPKYAVQYIVLDEPLPALRLTAQEGKLEICELTILTPGEPPERIQRWQDAPEKIDLMLLATHPDDEVLWFGGLLPLYAREQGKDVLVVNAAYNEYLRRLELLDCLWACGVEIYPVMLGYPDVRKADLFGNITVWSEKGRDPKNRIVSLMRQYKPDVVVLHDINGEYGHTAHKSFSYLGRQAVERAGNAQEHPESAAQWGVWEVPKTYIHLYGENRIQMDWSQPLASFGGKTAIEVATLALDFHVSQRNGGWSMARSVEYDNRLFGLWRTMVGPDVEKNDLFENIPVR